MGVHHRYGGDVWVSMRRAVSTTVVSGDTVTTSVDITDLAGIVMWARLQPR